LELQDNLNNLMVNKIIHAISSSPPGMASMDSRNSCQVSSLVQFSGLNIFDD
jgi:hypothetical protein